MRAEYARSRDAGLAMEFFGSARLVVQAGLSGLQAVPGIGPARADKLHEAMRAPVTDEERRIVEQLGLACLSPGDEGYPILLADEPSRPWVLWRRGRPPGPAAPRLAIVGTRRASEYGLRVTHEIAASAAERGIAIVSGLAFGIDRAAHEAALEAGGTTEAVLACGPERIYPRRHRRLAERILAAGAVYSEFPIGTHPLKHHFPRRNRIISGLAHVTVVVEAFERGGALITGRTAVEQGRHVFAVPGRIDHPGSEGTNGMLRDGEAQAVVRPEEVVEYYEQNGIIERKPDRPPRRRMKLSADDLAVLEAVGTGESHIDTILRRVDLPPAVLWPALLSLERRGLLEELGGNRYRWSDRARRRAQKTAYATHEGSANDKKEAGPSTPPDDRPA